ncbi:hypothetical protein C8J56DRAFT_282527 [Mycena floridula]|nr:hypothetical protein C8J56DRAFT_282527 [Mycena floridula]
MIPSSGWSVLVARLQRRLNLMVLSQFWLATCATSRPEDAFCMSLSILLSFSTSNVFVESQHGYGKIQCFDGILKLSRALSVEKFC